MEMNGRVIVKCEKKQIAQWQTLIEDHCNVEDSTYQKGLVTFFIHGSSDLVDELGAAMTTLSAQLPDPILGWLEGDEDPSITLLTATAEHGLQSTELDGALFEYLNECLEECDEDDDECELSEEEQQALALGPKKYFTQQYQTWLAPYKKELAQKDFKQALAQVIEGAD